MDIKTRKTIFLKTFLELTDEKRLSALEKLLYNSDKFPTEYEFNPMTIQQFNEEIDKAIEDYSNGKIKSVSELKIEASKWHFQNNLLN